MPTITLRFTNGEEKVYYAVSPDFEMVLTGQAIALKDNGTVFGISQYLGGILFDGCPANRVLYGAYTTGQAEALQAAGIVCYLDPPPGGGGGAPGGGGGGPSPYPTTAPGGEVPFVQAQPLIVVPTGEPTSTVVVTIVANVIGAIIGIFGRGLPDKVAKEIFSLRDAVVQLGRELVRLTQFLARSIKAVLEALRSVYEKVIKRALDKIEKINSRIGKIIDRVLGPYLQVLQRIRKIILDIYGRIFAPIIEAIQTIRKAIALLRILHVPGMKKLDEKLQQIQAKLIGVITALLRRTNDHSGLLNILLTLRNTLQHGLLLGSLHERRTSWISLWWNEQTPAPGSLGSTPASVEPAEAAISRVKSDMREYVNTGAGPMAAAIAAGTDAAVRAAGPL